MFIHTGIIFFSERLATGLLTRSSMNLGTFVSFILLTILAAMSAGLHVVRTTVVVEDA